MTGNAFVSIAVRCSDGDAGVGHSLQLHRCSAGTMRLKLRMIKVADVS